MMTVELANELLSAGLLWTPGPGDRFTMPTGELAGEVFYVANMTIDVHRTPTGTILGFNGTTEWALDSVAVTDVVWLPREDQLRDALGDVFVALRRADAEWGVEVMINSESRMVTGSDPETAYGNAVLLHLTESLPAAG